MTTRAIPAETRVIDWPALAGELAATLRDALALEQVEMPPALARAEGTWKGAPATIETRAWRGDRIAWCRVARVEGRGLAIGNLLCVPDARLRADGAPLPILGVDMVAIAGREAIVVADLSPLGSGHAAAAACMSAALDADPCVAALPAIADLPAWARESFSARALAVRVAAAARPAAAAAVHRVVDAFVALVTDARVDAREVCAADHARRRYLERHRDEDNGLTLLARIFGNEWAHAYIRDVLFPDLSESS